MNPSPLLSPVRISVRVTVTVGAPATRPLTSMKQQLAGDRVLREDVEARIEVVLLLGLAAELALDGHHGVDGDALADRSCRSAVGPGVGGLRLAR